MLEKLESTIQVYTIGFTKKNAEEFFTRLRNAGVKRLLDVRLNNVSQLAGFAKKEDLKFFLKEICDIEYHHILLLAPKQDMLDGYKKLGGNWFEYEEKFVDLMRDRKIEEKLSQDLLHQGCLLCSEATAEHCHRRLVVEYLQKRWNNLKVKHL